MPRWGASTAGPLPSLPVPPRLPLPAGPDLTPFLYGMDRERGDLSD